MDKLKYIAGHNSRSANKGIEQLILAHISEYEAKQGSIELSPEDYNFIRKHKKADKEATKNGLTPFCVKPLSFMV